MDDIQSTTRKTRKSLEEQLRELRNKELQIIAKREELEARVTEQQRKARTRAFVCMGAMVDKLMSRNEELKAQLLAAAARENIFNREGMGKYWPEFLPPESEIMAAKEKQKEMAAKRAAKKKAEQEADGQSESIF